LTPLLDETLIVDEVFDANDLDVDILKLASQEPHGDR